MGIDSAGFTVAEWRRSAGPIFPRSSDAHLENASELELHIRTDPLSFAKISSQL